MVPNFMLKCYTMYMYVRMKGYFFCPMLLRLSHHLEGKYFLAFSEQQCVDYSLTPFIDSRCTNLTVEYNPVTCYIYIGTIIQELLQEEAKVYVHIHVYIAQYKKRKCGMACMVCWFEYHEFLPVEIKEIPQKSAHILDKFKNFEIFIKKIQIIHAFSKC